MVRTAAMIENYFLERIRTGKIMDLQGLKKAYRSLVKKTHPDAVGSERLAGKFMLIRQNFEEACQALPEVGGHCEAAEADRRPKHRFLFFKELQNLDCLESPYCLDKADLAAKIQTSNLAVAGHFARWKAEWVDIFAAAQGEYDRIKKEKPPHAPYRKNDLNACLRPVFFNIVCYHLSGQDFYRKQLRQNLAAILHLLEERRFLALRRYVVFLIKDMEKGPAVFD
jgi:hypothetical protein